MSNIGTCAFCHSSESDSGGNIIHLNGCMQSGFRAGFDPAQFVRITSPVVPAMPTKRELFAAMSLQGILADSQSVGAEGRALDAQNAVKYADALIKALAIKTESEKK